MIRKILALFLLALPAVPGLAKPDPNYYPIACDYLWTAVKNTLNSPADYSILAIDDLSQRASFVVVGDLAVFKDVVILKSRGQGCSMKLMITQIGSDNSNERSFRGRLKRTLAKMPPPPPLTTASFDDAQSVPDDYPVSCDVLWTAVKDTLNNPADYSVLAIDDLSQRASFVVVGDLAVFKDAVIVKSRDKGCSIKLIITQIGSDNSNERSFRGRVKRTLDRTQRSHPPLAIGGISTASSGGAQGQPAAAPAPVTPAKPPVAPQTEPIWASTLTSQVMLARPSVPNPNLQRSGEKPSLPSPLPGPVGD